ncbi:kinase-like protein [Xylariaceae sp. FL0016]|nr:kinase-like protein [Xylariaceae sp. FL0016]
MSTTTGNPQHEENSTEKEDKPVLIASSRPGLPPYVLDPADLPGAFNPFPGKGGSQIRQIEDGTLVKYGRYVTLAEVEAMDYVSRRTSIKCPKVMGAYVLNGERHILMSFEHGKPLSHFWEIASDKDQETVIETLKQYMTEMRSIKGDYVGGFNRSPCVAGEFEWDFYQSDHKYGPYPDERAFNEGILEALSRASPSSRDTDPGSSGFNRRYALEQLVHSLRGHEIVFTHGDLHSSNIIIQDDLSVVILDWYTAGFYPAYWEWYKATWHGVFKPSFICEVERFIPPFWIEANIMHQMFDKILG